MNKTPSGNRKVIGIYGETNSGKSTIFNGITNSDIAIISEISGTTTDPVTKSMEFIPYGAVIIIDTAGINDKSELGEKRLEKTNKTLERVDIALYIIEEKKYLEGKKEYDKFKKQFKKRGIKSIVVINTKEDLEKDHVDKIKKIYGESVVIAKGNEKKGIEKIKKEIGNKLEEIVGREKSLLGSLLKEGSSVVLVTPIDTAAPKGRLILPQVQVIRDAIDNKIICTVCDLHTLESALKSIKKVDLVITDSQVFKEVNEIIGEGYKLTSFSILLARQKGDINKLVEGIKKIEQLKDGDKILMAEVCTHNVTHEDIGHVKIPKMLEKKTGKKFKYEYYVGRDYPTNVNEYSLIIHCGGCMITPTEMKNRIRVANESEKQITNYGVVIAYCNGILEKSIEILK